MRHFSIVVDPEWGGERHGPFTSPMRLGSDPRRCAMSLRSDLPVAGIHLTLEPSPNEWELVLVPHAHAPVYLWRNDRPWAIVEPCRIQHGEYFSLISPVGPRMRLEMHSGSGKRADPTRNSKRKAWIGLGLGVSFLCACIAFFVRLDRIGPSAPIDTTEPLPRPTVRYDRQPQPEPSTEIHWDEIPEGYHRNANRSPDDFPDRFAPISGENNWRSGRISGFEQLRLLREETGIEVVINLARDSYEHQQDDAHQCGNVESPCEPLWAEELGLEYVLIHMGLQPPNDQNWARIEQLLREGNVLIHCAYGVDRTGAVAARWNRCFDDEFDITDNEIIDYTYGFGGQWEHDGDPNQHLRAWMLEAYPCSED